MSRLQLTVTFFVLFAFSTVLYTSCIQDKCGSTVCLNKGVCVQSVCACPDLFEGSNCEIDWVDKFSGTWNADEVFLRDTSRTRYRYAIEIAGSADSFFLTGLGDTLKSIVCKRTSRLGFSFKEGYAQPDSVFTIVDGRGTLSADGRQVTGLYSFRYKDPASLSYRDTTITSSFKWAR